MESIQILAQVQTEESIPGTWMIFPLQRQKVMLGILGWIFGVIVGALLLIFLVPIMIPHNYQSGLFAAIFSTVLLGVVLYVFLGSIWLLIIDILRLSQPDRHIIIITPEDFVKREGKKIIHVPLRYIEHITARGTPPIERSAAEVDLRPAGVGEGLAGFFLGRRAAAGTRQGGRRRRRRRHTPITLAFIDIRTDREVVVVVDKAYGEPHVIADYLKEYVAQCCDGVASDRKE